MRALVLAAACMAFISLALRVPPEARVFGYYLEGFTLLVCLGLLATREAEE